MSKLLKSRVGYLAAGVYLLVTLPVIAAAAIIFVLRYLNDNANGYPIEQPINIGVMVLTLPWSIISGLLAVALPLHQGRLVFIICLIVGAIINASIFYLLGHWLSKFFTYLSDSEKPRS
jgi:hypothetical protein